MFDEKDSDFQCFITSFLPDEYDYLVIKFETIKSDKLNPQFLVELIVSVTEVEKVKIFLDELYQSSGCTLNIQVGHQDKTFYIENSRSKIRGYRKC